MKRVAILAVIAVVFCFGYWAANAQQAEPQPKEQTVTITKKQLEEIVEKRIAKRMLDESASLDQKILQPGNWHTAVFNGVEFTIYTGPGQVLQTRWAAAPQATPPAEGTEKPAEKPAAGAAAKPAAGQ